MIASWESNGEALTNEVRKNAHIFPDILFLERKISRVIIQSNLFLCKIMKYVFGINESLILNLFKKSRGQKKQVPSNCYYFMKFDYCNNIMLFQIMELF